MKKITILSLVLLCFGLTPLLVSADIIPMGYHSIDTCDKIVNINDFPDVVFIESSSSMRGGSLKIMKENECFSEGYKSKVSIYWNTKEKSKIIDENNLLLKDWRNTERYQQDSTHISKKDTEYSIFKYNSGKYDLQKTKVISSYNNGTPDKIDNFMIENTNLVLDNSIVKITKKLKIGLKNDNEVRYLQRILNKTMMSSLTEDGSFGLKTKIEVIKFQKANNLTADGVVGAKTMAVVNGM